MSRTGAAALVLVSLLALALAANTHQGEAQDPKVITINADGTVAPAGAPIQRDGNTYTLTTDATYFYCRILRSNIIFDGNGHTVSGKGWTNAFFLDEVSNVIVKNLTITGESQTGGSQIGIELGKCANVTISNNTITGTFNYVPWQQTGGIRVWGGNSNTITGNHVEGNIVGIFLGDTEHNVIVDNNITGNTGHGMEIGGSSNNTIRHNRFINNTAQIYTRLSSNTWDDGERGNYWSDYNGTDADGDGVGDTPYVVDDNNQDRYPLMEPYGNPKIPDEENPSAATAVIAASATAALGAVALLYFKKRRSQNQNSKKSVQTM